MNKLQRVTLAVASAAAAVGAAGLGVAAATANVQPAAASQAAPASSLGGGQVKANERVVEAFLQDVINEHNGNDVAGYLTPDMVWYGGTVGAVTGRANVAGLFASVVAAILAIPASGRHVQWDGVDIYRLRDGKISNIWAGDDWTAILNDTGTYKAPWIS